MKPVTRHVLATAVVLLAAEVAIGAGIIWSGAYDVGADAPHTPLVKRLLAATVDRSVEARARHLEVPPDFDDPARVTQGAGNYQAMCAECHLAPGLDRSELSQGLYPAPPNLSRHKVEPAEIFWIVKHGIKASAMPAWGGHMDDASIWSIAAFLQTLPGMNQQQYQEMVAESGGHSHGGAASGGHPEHDMQEPHEDGGHASAAHDRPTAGAAPESKATAAEESAAKPRHADAVHKR